MGIDFADRDQSVQLNDHQKLFPRNADRIGRIRQDGRLYGTRDLMENHFAIIKTSDRDLHPFYAVGIWNDFMSGLLYINDSAKWPIQLLLRQITMASSGANALASMDPNYAA